MVGIRPGDTIWRESFVRGRMTLTTSTIWNCAWREDRTLFCPVIITIGIAPSCA